MYNVLPTCILAITAVPSSPGAPEILAVGKDFATIEWLKPESDGGSPLTSYLIESREKKSIRWVKVNRDSVLLDTSFKISGLQERNIYQFRITAINAAGDSLPSELSMYAVCRVATCKYLLTYQSSCTRTEQLS